MACQGCDGYAESFFDWTGFEDRKGKKLCSVCAPTKYKDGKPTDFGTWHGEFERVFLPLGMFITDRHGNLAHIETGDTNFGAYALPAQTGGEPHA